MFTNKREIFSFRKYKAYGLASAVIAAFFLAGGVASADEVTAPTTTPAVAQTAPSEASTATNTEASTISAGETAPAVATTAPAGTAVASTETPVDGATYASDTAKQAVQDHLVPLAQSTTPAPTAAQIYKEDPAIAANLTSDDKAVEAENKEAFDKLPDAVRRRVASITVKKEANGTLGWTQSISGNVNMNAQYFHNDGKDGETEVLYHEIGHAVDGATYKRNADGSDYSLSRDAAVQPLIQKAYPGYANYEGWASLFGTYMLQKTGQREIKTDLDREINQYFTTLMVGFTEPATKINGNFVLTGTNVSEKHLTKNNQANGVYNLEGTYSFTASGTETVRGAKLVYEAKKQFLDKPTFSQSALVTKTTDKSDNNTWRYEFDLVPIGGTTAGQMTVSQRINGMIWSGPTSTEAVKGTFKVVVDNMIADTDTISVTTDRVKGGLYRSDVTPAPTDIRQITNLKVPTESFIGIYNNNGFVPGAYGLALTVPVPQDTWFLWNRNDANVSRDYERYTDFKYTISGIPDYMELDPTVASNVVWTRDGDKIVMHLTPQKPFDQRFWGDFQPRLRLKAGMDSQTQSDLKANNKSVKLTWRTDGTLPDGSVYTQELTDPTGINLKTRNADDSLPEGSLRMGYGRTNYPSPLREKADHSQEGYHVSVSMMDVDRSVKQIKNSYYYINIPKDQGSDYFTYFKPTASNFRTYVNGVDEHAAAFYFKDDGITLTEPMELYGVNAGGSTTKLASWTKMGRNTQGVEITGNYQKLVVKTPTLRDVRSQSADSADVYSWGADVVYAVDDARWKAAASDPSVQEMRNTIRTYLSPSNTLEGTAQVERTVAPASQINDTGVTYVHTRSNFQHELRYAINVNSPKDGGGNTEAKLELGNTAYVAFYGELGAYYQNLRTRGQAYADRLDDIDKVYTTVLVPDGVAVSNARVNVTNQLLSTTTAAYGSLTYTNRTIPVSAPVEKIQNYQGSGKTLYVYEAPHDAGILNAIGDLTTTTPGSGLTRPSVEMTFDFTSNGSVPAGSHEIQYATIWDKRSDLIDPVESQTLRANGLTFNDVLPTGKQDGFSDKKVSVIRVPFKIAYKEEYASRLYIGEDENSATESDMINVHLGKVLTVQGRSMNFSKNAGTLTDVIVTVPRGAFTTELVEAIPNGSNYRVSYTTDSDVKTGAYGDAPTDLRTVTAVKYTFNTPLTLNPGDNFVTNMKVRVPENAPVSTKVSAQLFTSANSRDYLDGNKVTITTTNNEGTVLTHFVDTEGHTIANSNTITGLNNTAYTVAKPNEIAYDGFNYTFKEVKSGSDAEQGQFAVDQTKQITYVYEKDTRGSVIVRHLKADNNMPLVKDQTIKDHVPAGEAYTTSPLTNSVSTSNVNGLTRTITQNYTLVETPANATGVVEAGKTTQVVYKYNRTVSIVTNGSVVATYKDTEGNELFPQMAVETNVTPGTDYTTSAKIFAPKVETVDGLTRTTTYTLTETPANATGSVQDGTVITVPYVYRKDVVTNGSVVATYKDTDGNELAPQESVQTNVEPGTQYTTTAKTIAPKVDEVDGFTRTTTYTLVSTPANATGSVKDGTVITVPYVYRKKVVVNGSVVATYKDREGNELAQSEAVATNVPDGTAYSTLEKTIPAKVETSTTPEGFTRTVTTKYTLADIPMNDAGSVEGGKTITVPYVYDKTETVTVNGSVIATYKDTEGNELAPQENVKTNVPDGEAYTTTAKTIKSSEVVEKTPEGLTKRTTTTYELTETPANAEGHVVGGSVTTVPYVYRKNVAVQTYGSVIATYKDEEGNELSSTEKVITNQPGGTYYAAAPKDIQGSAHATVTPEGRTVTITTYQLVKTPDNETGDVRDGEIIEVPYVYRKNVEERLVPGNTPTVEIPELKVTQYQTEAGVDVKASEQGFVDAPNTIEHYQFTGTTNTNDSGDVQTHIYKLIETEVPNDVPQVDVPALNVTRYVNEEGTEIKDAETGHVPAPSMIGDNYQFTGRTDSTEDGTVQTHVYKAVEHEVPNDAPKRLPEELQITRFVTEDGKDIAPIESGIVGERPVIGEYQYTGRSTHEEGIHTHYYKLIEHDVPNDAPQVDVPALNVTRYVNEEGSEIKDAEKGLVPAPSMIGDTYEFTGRTETTEDGTVQTHVYKVVEHQVPGDAPQVDVPKLLVTRFVNETGDEIKSATDSFVDALPQIDNYEFTGVTKLNDGKDVQTHVYRLSVHEVPNDAPQVDVPELQITRHVDGNGNDLTEVEKGRQAPKPTIREYQYTDRTTEEHGITTHFYAPIKHEVPNEAPIVDVPELLITRHVNEKGDELLPIEEGSNGPRKTIGDYEYTGRTDVEGGITTHVYAPIKYEVPNDAPIVDVPELQITRHIDEFGNDLVKVEKGRQAPKPTIREYQYTDRTTEEHGITTHFYAPIKHEVPNDAPIVEIPELQITRYVDGDGHDLQDPKRGHHEPEPKLGDYEFTGRTTKKDGITTHYYQRIPHVDEPKREVPTVETPKDEPKREVPTVETPKDEPKREVPTVETPKQEVPVVETPKAEAPVSDELPHTGDEVTSAGLALGFGLLGLFGLARRKREE